MLSQTEVAATLDEVVPSCAKLPSELSFEEVIKNNTLPPCSLNEFMDYLVYHERNAELLQLFTWYCGYVERFSELSPRQKVLSPPWNSEQNQGSSKLKLSLQSHYRTHSDKLNRIMSILEERAHPFSAQRGSGPEMHDQISRRAESSSSLGSIKYSSVADSETRAQQPFRDEVTKLVSHYLTDEAPRQLRISGEDLKECRDAVQVTTHPSALLPAFTAAETSLKASLHPKFIHWAQQNANRPRLIFCQVLGNVLILLGFAVNMVFIMSSLTQFYRIICLMLWWPGFVVSIAAFQGICVFLHIRNVRHLRPWEHYDLDDAGTHTEKAGHYEDRGHKHTRTATGSSTSSRIDPLRKPSMQPFGPPNEFDQEPWVEKYQRTSVIDKIFDGSVKTQNKGIRILRDRIVFFAICWGGLISTVLAVASLFIPSMGLF